MKRLAGNLDSLKLQSVRIEFGNAFGKVEHLNADDLLLVIVINDNAW